MPSYGLLLSVHSITQNQTTWILSVMVEVFLLIPLFRIRFPPKCIACFP